MQVRECAHGAAVLFLDDSALNLGNVFVGGSNVQADVMEGKRGAGSPANLSSACAIVILSSLAL